MSEKKDNSKKIFTIPNVISMFRLLLIPVFVWSYMVLKNDLVTVILIAVSGVSDVADGFIARRFNMVSDLGKALDPVADKLTQFAMLLCLVSRFPYLLIPFALLLVKEIVAAVTGMAVIKATNMVRGAEWHGKLATSSLYIMMILHLIWPVFANGEPILPVVSYISVGIATAAILLSFILYTTRNVRLLIQAKRNENNKEQ